MYKSLRTFKLKHGVKGRYQEMTEYLFFKYVVAKHCLKSMDKMTIWCLIIHELMKYCVKSIQKKVNIWGIYIYGVFKIQLLVHGRIRVEKGVSSGAD